VLLYGALRLTMPARKRLIKTSLNVRISEARYREAEAAAVRAGLDFDVAVEEALELWVGIQDALNDPAEKRRGR
jgi:hypothetical protein